MGGVTQNGGVVFEMGGFNPSTNYVKPIRRYRRRMHNIWKEEYGTEITEQRLCDQARMIKENEWITKLELKNIITSKKKDIVV